MKENPAPVQRAIARADVPIGGWSRRTERGAGAGEARGSAGGRRGRRSFADRRKRFAEVGGVYFLGGGGDG